MDGIFGKKPSDKEYEFEEGKSPTYSGKIIYVSDKGYGFVTTKEIPYTRIFFHWQRLAKGERNFAELKKGMKVEFNTTEIEGKGLNAINVKVIGE